MDTLLCTKCKTEQPDENFPRAYSQVKGKKYTEGKRRGRSSHCKICVYSRTKNWSKINPKKYKDGLRKRHLRNKYGITPQQYEQKLKIQNGRCAICNCDENSKKLSHKYFCVDHCHKTGKVRELLCNGCNSLLGHAEDNIEILKQSIRYLKNHA